MGAILKIVELILQLFGIGAQAAKESKDQQVGAALQKGADAEKAYDDLTHAMAARDAVVPLRPDGLRVDGTRDPRQRD